MSHQKGRLKNSKFWLCLSLILCLVSAIVASAVQTSGGIRIKEMSWESPSGHQLAAYLYIPQNATKDTPAPGVVTIEGWYNNKEMQDLYSIELARRGYVVLALDLHSHGDSESLSIAELYDGAVGVDGAVQLIASLPYVDTARIGVTGHSSGGTAANMAVEIDNSRETPLIAAVLQQAGDWQDDTGGDHSGDYGSRSVGIIASTHDDFYFGTYDDAGNMLTNPAAFMETDGAKKFLNFNEDGFAGIAEGGKYYTRDFDGKTAYRVIYRPNMIHPLVAFSTTCVGYAVDFFDTTLGAPKPLPASDQIWPIKAVFNSLGVIGLLIGAVLTASILYFKHRKVEYKRSFMDLFKEIHLSSSRTRWQICLSVGISSAMLIAALLNVPRVYWIGIAAMSVLIPFRKDVEYRTKHRVLGNILGSAIFFIAYLILPEEIRPCLGIIGGIGTGFSASYVWQSAFNAFSAITVAVPTFGLAYAVLLRIFTNVFGSIYMWLFNRVFDPFLLFINQIFERPKRISTTS